MIESSNLEAGAAPARRNGVGRVGRVFSLAALTAIAVLLIFRPG